MRQQYLVQLRLLCLKQGLIGSSQIVVGETAILGLAKVAVLEARTN